MMKELIEDAGLPPLASLVVNQFKRTETRAIRVLKLKLALTKFNNCQMGAQS